MKGEDDTWTMERAGYSFQLHSSCHTLAETTIMLVMMIITLKQTWNLSKNLHDQIFRRKNFTH